MLWIQNSANCQVATTFEPQANRLEPQTAYRQQHESWYPFYYPTAGRRLSDLSGWLHTKMVTCVQSVTHHSANWGQHFSAKPNHQSMLLYLICYCSVHMFRWEYMPNDCHGWYGGSGERSDMYRRRIANSYPSWTRDFGSHHQRDRWTYWWTRSGQCQEVSSQ